MVNQGIVEVSRKKEVNMAVLEGFPEFFGPCHWTFVVLLRNIEGMMRDNDPQDLWPKAMKHIVDALRLELTDTAFFHPPNAHGIDTDHRELVITVLRFQILGNMLLVIGIWTKKAPPEIIERDTVVAGDDKQSKEQRGKKTSASKNWAWGVRWVKSPETTTRSDFLSRMMVRRASSKSVSVRPKWRSEIWIIVRIESVATVWLSETLGAGIGTLPFIQATCLPFDVRGRTQILFLACWHQRIVMRHVQGG